MAKTLTICLDPNNRIPTDTFRSLISNILLPKVICLTTREKGKCKENCETCIGYHSDDNIKNVFEYFIDNREIYNLTDDEMDLLTRAHKCMGCKEVYKYAEKQCHITEYYGDVWKMFVRKHFKVHVGEVKSISIQKGAEEWAEG